MFQTQINHFLQGINVPGFHQFMEFISIIGLLPFVVGFILVITFGFDFRKGIVLLNVIALTAIITNFLKENIDYPRPAEVDHSLVSPFSQSTEKDFKAHLPKGMWEVLSKDILESTRNDDFKRYGFPSGHTSIQTALWISLMFLVRRKWTYWLGASLILFTMISRMYLGYHFLADVLGGLLIGALVPMLFLRWVKNSGFYLKRTHNFKSLSFLAFPLLLLPFAPYLTEIALGAIMGINLATLLQIQLNNVPINIGYGKRRIVVGLLGVLLFLLSFYLPSILGLHTSGFLEVFIMLLFCFLGFYGALVLGRRLYLYRN